jgi:serine protease Do
MFLSVGLLFFVFFMATTSWGRLPEFSDLSKEAGPAVVNVSTVKVVETTKKLKKFFSPFHRDDSPFDEFFDHFFGDIPQKREAHSLGSGFIISKDGYVVTNNHVIKEADKIKVILQGGDQTFPAEVVGRDPETDLALLKIDAGNDLPVLEFGDSKKMEVGEWVLAIGNPFGLDHTVTAGIISAKGRVIGAGPYDNFLQTDASINPGNSGGPLLNMDGEVIGINTAIVASGQGIGFAIPSVLAEDVIKQIKEYGKVQRGWLGVTIQDIDKNTAKALGLSEAKGALVASVMPGDPADKAGIQVGDVIRSIDGNPVEDAGDLTRTIGHLPPGETISIQVWRKGKIKTLEITLGERTSHMAQARGMDQQGDSEFLGMQLRPVNEQEADALGLTSTRGLLVVTIKDMSAAAEANMRKGDVILEANGKPVNSLSDFTTIIQGEAKDKGVLLLLIKRQGQNLFRTIPLENK